VGRVEEEEAPVCGKRKRLKRHQGGKCGRWIGAKEWEEIEAPKWGGWKWKRRQCLGRGRGAKVETRRGKSLKDGSGRGRQMGSGRARGTKVVSGRGRGAKVGRVQGWKGGRGAKLLCWECQSWEEAPGWGGRARGTKVWEEQGAPMWGVEVKEARMWRVEEEEV
jgi:hypothetical protein